MVTSSVVYYYYDNGVPSLSNTGDDIFIFTKRFTGPVIQGVNDDIFIIIDY
jgi:hypothetical protein